MSLYDIGCDDMGVIEYSPRAVKQQMKDVNTFLSVVNEDVRRDVSKTGNASFRKSWDDSVWNPWQVFFKEFNSLLSLNKLRDSTFKRAEAFRAQAIRFRENLEKKMNSEVTPTKVPAPIQTPDNLPTPTTASARDSGVSPWPNWLKWGLVVVGVGTGGYFVYKLVMRKKPRPTLTEAIPEAA